MQAGERSFFGRRKGKTLKPSQRRALERSLPALLLNLAEPAPDDLATLFPVPVGEFCLEIGFGGGEHLIGEARSRPETGFIGVEPFESGLAKAVLAIERDSLTNVRLSNQDAVHLLDWLPAATLACIDLLYPDPWPKTRHWKRRFVNSENLARMSRCLKPGGLFRFASDVDGYVKWTLKEVAKQEVLIWTAKHLEECREPWPGWAATRYEVKAVAAGRPPTYLTFRKIGGCSVGERVPASGENGDGSDGERGGMQRRRADDRRSYR